MDYTFEEYARAVHACGAVPLLVPAAQDRKSLSVMVQRVDGLILSGGPDLHPRWYGEEPHAALGEIDETLDLMELACTRAALERNLPLLAICRGIQVLNVALGGSLYQDIGGEVAGCLNHAPQVDKAVLTHAVTVERGSLLRRIMGRKTVMVNSKHHQAVREPGTGLRISAVASDGIIEAVEDPGRQFVLGVQWHPEGTWAEDDCSRRLFKSLVRAAGGR
jgi:putative glutamine amidotransferase